MNKDRVDALNIIRQLNNSIAADIVKNCDSGDSFDSESFDRSTEELKRYLELEALLRDSMNGN